MLMKVLTALKYQAKDHSTNQETLTELNKNKMNLHDLRRYLQALDRSQSQHPRDCRPRDRRTQHNERTNLELQKQLDDHGIHRDHGP